MTPPTIHRFIREQETAFESDEIQVGDNFYWSFRKHVQLIFHLKNGMFFTGENDWMRAFKNIMEPILELSYWTEDIEVKDVVFTIDNNKVLSFLVKKYHDEVYVKEHDLDTLFDEITESDLDYGGVMVQKGSERPEVIPLNSVAFCDQTDALGGPIAFKFYFTPDKLRSMGEYGWGEEKNGATITLEELATLADFEKDALGTLSKKQNRVPGKTIEVYVVRGNMPNAYINDDNDMENSTNQIQVVAFYTGKSSIKGEVILYRKTEEEGGMKFFTSRKVYGRALGRGVGERIIHPQIWTNFLTIHKTALLESASKVPLWTDDPSYTTKNKIQDMENLEITVVGQGRKIGQVPTAAPANIQIFQNDINSWFEHAQGAGDAYSPLRGEEPVSGTTFRGQERLVAQGRGPHDRRKGQRAKFIEELYRDYIIPDIKKEILKGQKFMATLSGEELSWIAERLTQTRVDEKIKDMVLNEGKVPAKDDRDTITQITKDTFFKQGNRHLMEILKGEFKDAEIKISVTVANKQKNLADLSDKLLSIFQFVFQNPQAFMQAMQVPALAKSFENILEFSGMSTADFSSLLKSEPIQQGTGQTPQQGVPSPLQLSNKAPA